MSSHSEQRFETLAVHAGDRRPGPEGSVVFPIYQSTVFEVSGDEGYHDIRYIRLNCTPSQTQLHERLAQLEGAEEALATGSGMAALTATLLSFLRQGDHVLCQQNLYGGTHEFLVGRFQDLGMSYTFVDVARPESWKDALRDKTRLFLTETISNPLMRVPQLRAVADFAREHDLVSVIDNTFASPVNFRPLAAGFDIVFHSATKYLNGHSDLVAGCVMGSAKAIERIRKTLNLLGGTLDPHAGFLLSRGIKTLALRVAQQNANGMALARVLESHDRVKEVNYPGLESHPDHAQAREFLQGFGGMLSVRLQGGVDAAGRLFEALTIPFHAPSLGGVETLIIQPAASSHANLSPEDRERVGVTDDLVRISVGIEHVDDLIADFDQALAKI